MPIFVYNRTKECHSEEKYNIPIFRGVSCLCNPYTHIKDKKTKARYIVKDRDEAIKMYDRYFDVMYSGYKAFQQEVDKIYEAYKAGENVYLECYCHPEVCHGDVIANKLRQRYIKEQIYEGYKRKKSRDI